jgi:hypothetical protein
MTDLIKSQGVSVTYVQPDPIIVQQPPIPPTPPTDPTWIEVPIDVCDYSTGVYSCYTMTSTVLVPGTVGTPAIQLPPQIITSPPQQIINVYEDRAWDSYATSTNPINEGQYIEFKVLPSSYAVFVGIDTQGITSLAPNSYRYGLMIDAGGVQVFENGVLGAYLGVKTTNPLLRIGRSTTGQVYYHYVGNPMVASTQAPIAAGEIIHGYGLLYSSGDTVQDATIATLSLVEATVAVPLAMGVQVKADPLVLATSTLDIIAATDAPACAARMVLSVSGTLVRANEGDATAAMSLGVSAEADAVGRGMWTLPAVLAHGADYDDPGFGTVRLPRVTAKGTEGTYVPAAPDEGWWVLPRAFGWGLGLSEDVGSGAWTLTPLDALGTEEGVTYAQAYMTLPHPLKMTSVPSPWAANVLDSVSVVRPTAGLSIQRDIVLVVNSYGQLTSTLTLTRQQTVSLLSTLAATTNLTLVGTYLLDATSLLIGQSMQSLTLPTGAEVPEDAAVWVVNLDGQSKASVQYENYGFNSFFQQDGAYYGVANDGIYELAGGTDAGAPIQAYLNLGRSNMDVQGVKHMPSVYIGAASDGKLILRTDTDGVVRYYRARVSTADLTQQRVDIGRGVRGTYWELEVINENGDDFDLADLTLLPVALDRRV